MNTKRLLISIFSSLVFAAQLSLASGVPGNVTAVNAIPMGSDRVQLVWDAVVDADGLPVDHYRVYYDTGSFLNDDIAEYGFTMDTTNDDPQAIVTGLNPNTRYYFAVTGISEDGLESGSFSLEGIATTQAAAPVMDDAAPAVNQVVAVDKTHVRVVFSEPVTLPAVGAETAFTINEQINTTQLLAVEKAEKDTSDSSGKTVLLTTAPQTPLVNYVVVVGVSVKDQSNNPIISGTADTGLFVGSELEAMVRPAADTVVDCKDQLSCFVPYLNDCTPVLVEEGDEELRYQWELTGERDGACDVLVTAVNHPNNVFLNSSMTCLMPKAQYNVVDFKSAFTTDFCEGTLTNGYIDIQLPVEVDVTPPEDVTNLVLSFRRHLEQFVVTMKWTPSINTAKDLVDQILYMSLDRGTTYDSGTSLGALVSETEVPDLEGGKEYTFKLTTKDASGNESTGLVKAIRLPQTGAGVGLMLLGSGLVARRTLRRKRRRA